MKHVKRILAFALTFAMAFGFALTAYAAESDLKVDAKVTVTGFEEGDTVSAYQFITWTSGEGWTLADDITGITLDEITDGLTPAELAILASAENVAKMTEVTGTTNGTTWEYVCGTVQTAGSYLILVSSNSVDYIYNPAVVSASFDGGDPAVDLTEDDAMLKKQNIKIEKTADNAPDDYDVQFEDIIPFTVKVTVPQYSANWTEPYFAVTDELSTGLTIKDGPTIEGLEAGTDYTLANGEEGDAGFTITFTDDYLKNNASATLEIKYTALVGDAVMDTAQIHEETNKATLEFSNNPSNSGEHKTVDDETHHYTFAIDATRFGQDSEKTKELIKVGVDADGNPITMYEESAELPSGVSPLAGAEFTLTGTGANNTGEFKLTATSEADGRVFFNNLEAGTYTLTETKAPEGYIKDPDSHSVVISAEYNDDTTLNSYTIKIDGEEVATYTATTNSENVKVYEIGPNNTFPINNKKGTELPSTGGIGTTIFYVVGGVMVAGAAIFLLTKRRAAAAE